jgi:hypothetical protein
VFSSPDVEQSSDGVKSLRSVIDSRIRTILTERFHSRVRYDRLEREQSLDSPDFRFRGSPKRSCSSDPVEFPGPDPTLDSEQSADSAGSFERTFGR